MSATNAATNPFGIDVAAIPEALRNADSWVNWKFVRRNKKSKPTKPPVRPNGLPADTTDPQTWSKLQEVLNPPVAANGIGFVFTGQVRAGGLCIGGIDLDDLNQRRENETDDSGMFRRLQRANRIVREARARGAYVEKSPSGGGIHIIGLMPQLAKGIHRDSCEIYAWARYFTFTTKSASGNLVDITDLVQRLIDEIAPNQPTGSTGAPHPGAARTGSLTWDELPAKVRDDISWWLNSITDGGPQDRAARNRLWFNDLSDHNGDHSAADLSFVSQLIHRGMTDDEADLAMRASGLYRPKWDARRGLTTYGWITIAKARQRTTGGSGGSAGGGNSTRWAPPGQRSVIEIHAGKYHLAADAGLAALAAAGAPFYQQGGRLVEVCRVPHKLPAGETIWTPAARSVPAPIVARTLTQCVEWRRMSGELLKQTEPPKEVVAQIMDMSSEWPFLPLRGVCATQLMRPDGSLLTEPGYDEATGLVLFDPPGMPPIPEHPTRDDALAALQLLAGLIDEFPFVVDNGVSHSAALSLLLTAVQRGAMPVTPMFVTVKPQPGTGGSYLADVVGAIALGDIPPVLAWSTSEEENDKRLQGMALAQKPIIAIDNVSGVLHSDFLCQLTERQLLSCRPLGGSKIIEVANSALVVANGNNLEISTDEVRRTVQILLDANVERPEERTFTKNPVALVLADRGKYVAAVLTIVRAYHLAGRPGCLPPRASYEIWSNMVRSALVWLGGPDPDLSLNHVRAQDTRASQRAALVTAWAQELQLGVGYRTQEIVDAANERTSPMPAAMAGATQTLIRPALREALLEVAPVRGRPDLIDSRRLGQWLHRHVNTVSGVNKITADHSDQARPRFILT